MPTPKALTPSQAKRTLANRLSRVADRLRQFSTRFGLRSERVFLVWTFYRGEERGAGEEVEIRRYELLPTPRVGEATSIALTGFPAGVFGTGTIRVDLISATLTKDELEGRQIPAAEEEGEEIQQPYDFFWEIVEDGRGGNPPKREKYRMAADPERDEGNVSWTVVLERVSEDRDQDAESQIGVPEGGC